MEKMGDRAIFSHQVFGLSTLFQTQHKTCEWRHCRCGLLHPVELTHLADVSHAELSLLCRL